MTVDLAEELHQARVLVSQGHKADATEMLDAVLLRHPLHTGALLLKADLLLDTRDAEAALHLYREAVASAPHSAEALNGLARGLHALERDDEAITVATEARALLAEGDNFRHTGAVYLTLVWCLREQRRYAEALALAEEGLARMPDAVLAQWASVVEEELAESQKEEC